MDTTIPEAIPENTKEFFRELTKFINTDIYFYGSIFRKDYYPKNSDVDVCIFCNDQISTIDKIFEFISLYYKKYDYNCMKEMMPVVEKSILHFVNNKLGNAKYSIICDFDQKLTLPIRLTNSSKCAVFDIAVMHILDKPLFLYEQKYIVKLLSHSHNFFIYNFIKYIYYNLRLIDNKTMFHLKKWFHRDILQIDKIISKEIVTLNSLLKGIRSNSFS